MADVFSQVFEGKCAVRDVETKRVRVHRVHKSKDEEALLELIHPNIIKLLHCGSDDDYLYYALGPCLATLDQLFLKSDDVGKYNGPSGLKYIHSNNSVHGDIKPENILIAQGPAGPHEITLKWTNFELIKSVSEERQNSSIRRNREWLAPELLQLTKPKENVDETSYPEGVKSDVFALGLVFGSLFLNGEHLYGPTGNENEIADNIVIGNPINMQKMDGKLRDCYEKDLLENMLKNDPNERMTSKEVDVQLNSIKDKLRGKEKELLELCGRDSREDLTGKIKELIQFEINLNAKDKEGNLMLPDNAGWNALYYLQNKDKKEMKIWLDRQKPIGAGGFGTVFKGKFGGREVAVKRLEMRHVDKIEEEAMLKLDHPNIVKLLHCEKDEDFTYYALELCAASLDQLFLEEDDPKKYNGCIPRQVEVFHQLAKGLEYIHSMKLIHRDIKPENILITQMPGEYEEIIIQWADFGLSKKVTERGSYTG
ncbi:uncharacterized protein LOC130694039 [Daphnia carinata]|uniref:uncharacterized protein LOC130694039 n=1 Tax=Daphnia carinata TaxID=120202 RepID=UPI002868B68D|nr:uncharacterized protein LOC130694039 [Daphnia carinata]